MTKKCFVIGHPINHSKSPIIHSYWLNSLGISGSYEAIDINPEKLSRFISSLREEEFCGGNVTVPHKEKILDLCNHLSPEAVEIGAVNTLVVTKDQIRGSNTDMYGFLANLDHQAPDWYQRGKTAIVLGAGGAARAILVALRNRGFETIHILNRTLNRAQSLAKTLKGPFTAHTLDAFADLAPSADLLVNTTTIGMNGTSFGQIRPDLLPSHAVVTDIVYTPLMTPLLAAAQDRGLQTVDGLGMLLHQAVPGFEAWFGHRPEVTPQLRDLIVAELEQS